MRGNYVRFFRTECPTLCSCCGKEMHEGVRIYSSPMQGSWIICDECAEAIGEQASDPGAATIVVRGAMRGEYVR